MKGQVMTRYGGFWWRALAYLIDAIILQLALSVLGGALGFGMMLPLAGTGSLADAVIGFSTLGMILVLLVGQWLYFALMESSRLQGTLGKLAVGLIVTDEEGRRINFMRATGRYFAKFLSGLILCIGYVMAAFSARKQALHDMMAGTLVYRTRDPSSLSAQ